jgi:hypothetical protein
MMDNLKIPIGTQLCFVGNLEPDSEGCYPDWSSTSAGKYKYTFKHRTGKVCVETDGEHTEELRFTGFTEWTSNENPDRAARDGMLGVDEKTALKFCIEWYRSKRQETAAIWKQRKQRVGSIHEFSLSELQEEVREYSGTETNHETT